MGGALIAVAAAMGGCVGAGGQDMAAFPKFSDIPKRAAPKVATEQSADVRTLQAMAAELAKQDAVAQTTDTIWTDSARALAAIPTVGAADIADSEAFARAARARATPPPSRN